jgi:glycosyltransferase involved in cell wall biosynthesis
MRLEIVNSFKMQWEDGYSRVFGDWDVNWVDRPDPIESPDCRLFMWCNEPTINFLSVAEKRNEKWIVFIRRFEYYQMPLHMVPWEKVDAVIMVNDALAYGFEQRTKKKPIVVYNGITPEKWTFRGHGHGKKIAMVGFICHRKNLPLAAQIMMALPKDYELHVAGEIQTPSVVDYTLCMANTMGFQIGFHGKVDDINGWLQDMDYLLCTSISEGSPNSIIEAMACGIKPVIHNWIGSKNQFNGYTYDTVGQAVAMMDPTSPYSSKLYRELAELKFGPDNFNKVKAIIERTVHGS